MNIRKGLFCLLSLFIVCTVGCETAPVIGFIPQSEEVDEGYKGSSMVGAKGIYVDYNGPGQTTKRALILHDGNNKEFYRGEKDGVTVVGRLLSNAGAPLAVIAPWHRYFGDKTRRADRTNVSATGGTNSSDAKSDAEANTTGGDSNVTTIVDKSHDNIHNHKHHNK